MNATHLAVHSLEARAPRSPRPWTPDQLVGLLAVNVVGLVLLCIGWWQTAAREPASEQLGWLNLSGLGVALAGAANGFWLARGRRVVTLAKDAVMPYAGMRRPSSEDDASPVDVWVAIPATSARHQGSNGAAAAAAHGGGLVAGAGMTRYHVPQCLLAAGKDVVAADRSDHEGAGRHRCEVCRP